MRFVKFSTTLFTLLILAPILVISQVKGVVRDAESSKAIPYVNIWVEGGAIGTTSNINGEFELKNARNNNALIFSAIGYETKQVKADSNLLIIKLTPSTTELSEVVIRNKKASIEQKIGIFNKSKINSYFGCGSVPWMVARYFPYKENYENTTFLKEIKILTNSDVKDAKKGKSITKIDLSDLFIQFPKEGFFVVMEWLIIKENYYKYWTTYKDKRKVEEFSYEPSVGFVFRDSGPNSFSFSGGKWKGDRKLIGQFGKETEGGYSMLAIELILSN